MSGDLWKSKDVQAFRDGFEVIYAELEHPPSSVDALGRDGEGLELGGDGAERPNVSVLDGV